VEEKRGQIFIGSDAPTNAGSVVGHYRFKSPAFSLNIFSTEKGTNGKGTDLLLVKLCGGI